MKRNLPSWALVTLNSLMLLSTVLPQLKTVGDALPLPASIFWFLVVAVTSCLAVWVLATAPKSYERLVDVSPYPKYRLRWALLTCIFAGLALYAVGGLVAETVYPRTYLHAPAYSHTGRVLPECERSSSLKELYACVNTDLIDAVAPHRNYLVLVTGSAGSGKSFLLKILKAKYNDARVIKLCEEKKNAREHFCADCEGLTYEERAELTYGEDGKHRFNSMSAIKDFSKPKFFHGFEESGLGLIDDLDELHPDSATYLLNSIAAYVAQADTRATVVVFGRPESFFASFSQHFGDSSVNLPEPIVLIAPTYESETQIRLLAADWAANAQPKRRLTDVNKIAPALFKYSKSRPWVRQSLQILNLANFLCERFEEKTDWEDLDLKERLRAQIFDRAHRTHGRPQFSDELYKPLFSQVAMLFAKKVQSSGEFAGYFPVGDEILTVQNGERTLGTIKVRHLLRLSGIAYLNPSYWQQQYWRFEPQWIHEYLIEKKNADSRPRHWSGVMLAWISLLVAPAAVFILGWRRRHLDFSNVSHW